MRRSPAAAAAAFAVVLGLALLALAQESITIREYFRRREGSTSPEAYLRAAKRLEKAELGMRTDQFFEKMEMMFIQDKKGRGVDGFCEGHMQAESLEMSKGKEPDHYLVFGYYQDFKKKKGVVKKFYVVFRHKLLREIAFFDPADDTLHLGAKASP